MIYYKVIRHRIKYDKGKDHIRNILHIKNISDSKKEKVSYDLARFILFLLCRSMKAISYYTQIYDMHTILELKD